MVENAPKPETPIPIVLLANPVTPALRVLSYCIVMLDNLDFSKNEQLESRRKYLVHGLMCQQEALERLVGQWELEAAQKAEKGEGN